MRLSTLALSLTAACSVGAAPPFKFPLGNGFPNPSMKAIATIEGHAGGSLPNTPLPSKLKPEGVATLQLLALQEIFEVAYFTDLLKNITNGAHGYDVPNKKETWRMFRRIRAQEELHALGINAILKNSGEKTVDGCKYVFPVKNFLEAVTLADIFTEVVLGVLPAAQMQFIEDGGDEAALVPLIGSIIGQEGEQTGVFRHYQGKVASSAPFLTGGAPQLAFSALKMFIVPGSCSVLPDVPSFTPITVLSTPEPKNMKLKFEVKGTGINANKHSLAYISGQNYPVTVPISDVATKGGMTTFKAEFPFVKEHFAKGLTLAAVVKGTKKFDSPAAAADAAVYGPALIPVQ